MKFTEIPEAKSYEGVSFPIAITPSNDDETNLASLLNWISGNLVTIDDMLRRHKGILFRGFHIHNASDMHNVVVSAGYEGMDYIGGAAVRTQLTDRIFTANESPPSERIPFHHEMAQTPAPPTHLFFFCEVAATTGGETPILNSVEIYEKAYAKYPEFMVKLEQLGLKYIRIMPENDDPSSAIGRGWKSTFLTETKEGAEEALKVLGSTWEWLLDGNLRTVTTVVPGIRIDEGANRTNKKTFFNSLVAAFSGWNDSRNIGEKAVVFGDDSPCDAAVIHGILDIMDEICVAFPWQNSDLLLLDNRTTMHSRRPFTGPRRVLASLARDPSR